MNLALRTFFLLALFALSTYNAFSAVPALREQVSLNGTWTKGGSVPHYVSQEVAFDTRTYERTATAPAAWNGKRIKLEFNAVNWYCDVYINNTLIGSHTGAWVPFEFDITSRITPGTAFTLRLEVKGMLQPPTKTGNNILWWIGHNELDKYRAGIVDDVWLRAYGQVYIDDAFVQTSFQNKTIKVDYTITNKTSASWTGKVTGEAIRESSGSVEKTVTTPDVTLAAGETKTVSVTSSWTTAAIWWPDQPNLYHMKSTLSGGGKSDIETRRFGFREFWIVGNQFRLNGIRLNVRGDWSCFSQYWGRIPDVATLRTKYEGMLKTNANMLRWHKHPAPRFAYDLADEMGIMVINESPFYGRPHYNHNQKTLLVDNCVTLVPAWIKAARNHACVVIWSACNEATYSGLSAMPAAQLKRLGDAIYAVDSTRPVNYDGDHTVPGVMLNRHYPEGYEKNPTGDVYSAWTKYLDAGKPTYFGEILAVRPESNDNGWWIGVWTRGLRYIGFAGIAPRVFYDGGRINDEQEKLQAAAYNPIALFDIAYDKLGIAPHKDNVYPSLDEGAQVTRRVVLYNDDYRNTAVTAEVELFVDGVSAAKGTKAFTLNLGSKYEFDVKFQAPFKGGKAIDVVLRTFKGGVKKFEEAKRFNLRETGASGTPSTVVTLDGNTPPPNQAPNCSITAPTAGTTFTAPASIQITASATDSDGTIAKVEFYNGSALLSTVSTSPFRFTWNGVTAGTYSLTAKAFDDDGATKTSAAVSVTVTAPNQAPTVSFTAPLNGASLTAPADLTVTATAADSDGTVAKVELFLNGTLVRAELGAPYSWGAAGQNDPAIKGLATGSYTLRVVATDDDGATAQTSIVISVKAPMAVVSLTLINADTDLPVAGFDPLANNAILDLSTLPTRNLNIRANTNPPTVGSVVFGYDGNASFRVQGGAPYSLANDDGGNYFAWTPSQGAHTVTATPYSAASGGGTAGTSTTIAFTVKDPPALTSGPTATPNPASVGQSIQFQTAATDPAGDVLTYSWNFGDGTTVSGATAQKSYTAAGTYTATVTVNDGKGGADSASVTVVVREFVQLSINFQTAGSDTPAGALADEGAAFGERGNGKSFGWNADNALTHRNRNSPSSPDERYDTLAHLQKATNPDAVWEIALPNGSYSVRAVCGDASFIDSVYVLDVEGVTVVNGTPTATARWFEGTRTVTVTDGKLTVRNGAGAANNKLCFLEIRTSVSALASARGDEELEAGSAASVVFEPLTVKTLRGTADFSGRKTDAVSLAFELPGDALAAGALDGVAIGLDIGGAVESFTLLANGRGKNARGTIAVRFDDARGVWLANVALKKGRWSAIWKDGLRANADSLTVPVAVSVDGRTFGGATATAFKGSMEKTGSFNGTSK